MIATKDLTTEPPRSPRVRVGRYIILARMADKGRAELNGVNGEYHFNCPLDKMLFDYMQVDGEDVRELLRAGKTDEQIAEWLDQNGAKRQDRDLERWAREVEQQRPYENLDKRGWFIDECRKVGLDPVNTTLFELLDADDRRSFEGA